MSGVNNMNIVIGQTPTVEKIQHPQHQQQDQTQRHVDQQELAQFRQRTETVPEAKKDEAGARLKNEEREKKERDRRQARDQKEEGQEKKAPKEGAASPEDTGGRIVDVVI